MTDDIVLKFFNDIQAAKGTNANKDNQLITYKLGK